MTDDSLTLERLKNRRVRVDLTTPNGTPLKAITIVGRCSDALRAARVSADEVQAFLDLVTRRARGKATAGTDYAAALASVMNEPGFEMLRLAREYLAVTVNWDVPSGGE